MLSGFSTIVFVGVCVVMVLVLLYLTFVVFSLISLICESTMSLRTNEIVVFKFRLTTENSHICIGVYL